MKPSQKILRKWSSNFAKSPLVDKHDNRFRRAMAYQLFYGKNSSEYPDDYPQGFQRFYNSAHAVTKDEAVETTLRYLNFVGIKLRPVVLQAYLQSPNGDYKILLRKTYYILKTLAHTDELDINSPYKSMYGDVDHLLRIETGQSQLTLFEAPLPQVHGANAALPEGYSDDPIVRDHFEKIENSNDSFFITGKAGTGKSTFVLYFTQSTRKTVVRLAFTGVAAMNVGGVTIHSFFRFPLRPMLPGDEDIKIFGEKEYKRQVIEATDTFVIDEVSMLRADVLEAIDYSLRQNGGHPGKPFGGKQILFVGDPFQLPPVTNEGNEVERYLFNEMYNSSYFFDSDAYRRLSPRTLMLTKSHRQKEDLEFVELLDRVRMCSATEETVAQLNQRLDESHVPVQEEFSITLSATNAIARQENERRLAQIHEEKYTFPGNVNGDIDKDQLPGPEVLELKRGAQVIFIRNDTSGQRRWVNGTLGIVEFIAKDIVEVRLADGSVYPVERETWEQRGYKFDRERSKVISEVRGLLVQYPLRLAWAITIHKSQGLTFDKVIIDLGSGAFVNGQLYTALSRCRRLSGITLKRPIQMKDIIQDKRLMDFYRDLSPE